MSDLIERLQEDAEWNSAPQLNDPAILKTAALEREAAKRMKELEAEVAALRVAAGRWEFMRRQHAMGVPDKAYIRIIGAEVEWHHPAPDVLDKLIDAAIKEQQ